MMRGTKRLVFQRMVGLRAAAVAMALLAAACQPGPTPATLEAASAATALPANTATPETALPAARPTAAPVTMRAVSIVTRDGVTLAASVYGQGTTAVIFSNRSDKGQASWASMAERAAQAGYLALTFDYRAWRGNGQFELGQLNQADIDLLAVADFAKSEGAQAIALVGASLGGIASAKDTTAVSPAALIIIGSPMSNSALTITVEPAELQNSVPKLFIASEGDMLVPAAETRRMYDLAAEPKTYFEYPGSAHGTDLLLGPPAGDLAQKLLEFLQAHAPALAAPS